MYSVVGSDGQVYGPVDMQTLGQWIAEGRVTPTTNLIDPLDGRVLQAGNAPALIGNFPATSMQAPPMPGTGTPQNPYGPYVNVGQTPIQINVNNGYPVAPYGAYGPPKTKLVAILLAFFLGGLGIHRFYLGHKGTGIAMLLITVLTCGYGAIITGPWALIDIILIATDSLREENGRALE